MPSLTSNGGAFWEIDMTKQERDKLRELAKIDQELGHFTAPLSPAAILALLDRVDELEAELADIKADAERYKRELQQKELVHVGYTNPYQIKYAKDEEGSFYPDTDNECYIPLYMLKKHKHRLGPDAAIDKARGQE